MSQYFIEPDRIVNGRFSTEDEEARHIIKVARHRVGSEIEIFDGQGHRYRAVIEEAGDDAVSGSIKDRLETLEYRTRLTLCFAPVARSAAESIFEHCTEAGVAAFQPVFTSRTQFDWFDNWESKAVRFRQITIAACKQSGRAMLPELLKPQKMDDVLALNGISFLALENAGRNFSAAAGDIGGGLDVKLFIGPEGGFTKGETEFAVEKGARPFSLGKHTLRAETAALAASAIILDRLG